MRRYAYLDHIRWMTVLLVIVYHVCYLFNGVGILGGVPNARNLPLLDTISGTVYPWFMVLLFVVAGMCARFALVQQGNRAFLRNRARKLLVPSTLGLFVLHWVTGISISAWAARWIPSRSPCCTRFRCCRASGRCGSCSCCFCSARFWC